METHNHSVLKKKAVEWLYLNAGCKYVALELKIGKYIFDAVGCDGSRVFIIEAKQEFNDFKRDCNNIEDIQEAITSYRHLLKETGDLNKYKDLIEKEREKSIKFTDSKLLKLSSHRYIIAPDDLIEKEDIPENWGLLNEEPRVKLKCEGNVIDKRFAEKVIREIARKQTKNFLLSEGVEFNKKIVNFPQHSLI